MNDPDDKSHSSTDKLHRAYLDGPFTDKRHQQEQAQQWQFVDASARYNSAPLEDTLISQVFVFQVT